MTNLEMWYRQNAPYDAMGDYRPLFEKIREEAPKEDAESKKKTSK